MPLRVQLVYHYTGCFNKNVIRIQGVNKSPDFPMLGYLKMKKLWPNGIRFVNTCTFIGLQ